MIIVSALGTICAQRYNILILFLGIAATVGPVYADSGSAQAVMALIVPPHPAELTEQTQEQPAHSTSVYNHEFELKITQQAGSAVHQIWVTF